MTGNGPPGGDDGRSASSRNSEPILTGLPFRPASVPAPAPSATGPLAVQPAPPSHPSSPPPTFAGPQAIKSAPHPVQSIEAAAAAASVRTQKQTARLVAAAPAPAPPELVRAAPPHVDKSEWVNPHVPQKRAPDVPLQDVAPPAWTQSSDWNAQAASNAAARDSWMPSAAESGSARPPAPAPASVIPPAAKAPSIANLAGPGSALTASAQLSESIGAPPGFVAPAMELVFYDDTFFSHLRRHFRVLCEEMEPDPTRSFGEDVAEVLHVLASAARARDPKVIATYSQRRVGAGALPPIEVWDGVLAIEVDPIERLRLEVEAARRLLGPAPEAVGGLALELSRAVALVQADLDSASGLSARRAAIRLRELKEHTKSDGKRDEEHALDLLEKRAYRTVEVFGGSHVRGTLKVGAHTMTVYMAASAANALPLLPSVGVTIITERRARQEQDAASDIALHVRALARHMAPTSLK